MQLDERLRKHIDGLAEPVSLETILERAEISANTRLIETAKPEDKLRFRVAAVIVVVLTIVAAMIVRQNESSTVFAEETTPALQSLPIFPQSPALWQEIDTPFTPRDPDSAVVVNAALTFDGLGWAVGSEWMIVAGDGTLDVRKRGAIWRSEDGATWAPVDADFGALDTPAGNWVPSGIGLEHIVSSGNALFVFGNEYRNGIAPVAYRSNDGSNWQPIELPFETDQQIQLTSVDVSDSRIAALVINDGAKSSERAELLVSHDRGDSWEVRPVEVESSARLSAMALRGERAVLVGFTEAPVGAGQTATAAVWYSDDLTTWTKAHTPTSPSVLIDIENGPDGLVAAGMNEAYASVSEETGQADTGVIVWNSQDGSTWTVLDLNARADDPIPPALIAHDAGVLALASRSDETGTGVEALTTTADETTSLGHIPASQARTVLVIDGRLVVIGSKNSLTGEEFTDGLTVWLAQPTS